MSPDAATAADSDFTLDIDGYAAYLHTERNDPAKAAGPCCAVCRREEPADQRGTYKFVSPTMADDPERHKYYDPDALCPEHYAAVCTSYRDMVEHEREWKAERAAAVRAREGDSELARYYEAEAQEAAAQ